MDWNWFLDKNISQDENYDDVIIDDDDEALVTRKIKDCSRDLGHNTFLFSLSFTEVRAQDKVWNMMQM
jgi:hypothetical protein